MNVRTPLSPRLRAMIKDRDGHECLICGSRDPLHIDHIIPVSKGGTDDPDNLRVLCQRCNLEKGADDFHPSEGAGWDTKYDGADLTNSMIIWDSGHHDRQGRIEVISWPDTMWGHKYEFSWGACCNSVREATFMSRSAKLAHYFVLLTVVYRVAPERVAKALARLAEFRYGFDRKMGWRDREMWNLGLPREPE